MKKIVHFSAIFVMIFSVQFLLGQNKDVNETLSNLSNDAARAYVSPVISAFGSNLNAGWVNKAPEAKRFGIDLDIKIVGMGSFFDDAQKTFSTSGTFRFTSAQADQLTSSISDPTARAEVKNQILSKDFSVGISGPTLIGSGNENVKITFNGESFNTSKGNITVPTQNIILNDVNGFLEDLSVLPMGAVQFNVGTLMGTSLSFRWLPSVEIKDLGQFNFWGIGGMHNPAVWLDKPLPVDVAFGVFYQSMDVGTVFNSTATQYGVFVSKSFNFLFLGFTPYISVTGETSSTTITYDYEFDTPTGTEKSKIDFSLDGENSGAFTVGGTFKLAILNFSVDYKLANTNTLSASVFFGF